MQLPCFEGWMALAALAMATERVRVGCLVTGVTYRHPSVLAKMAATVDHMSGGRLEFAIGAAWHEPEHRVYGIPFPPVRERQDRLEEAAQLIRMLFRAEGGTVSFEGKYYRLQDAPFSPPCIQKPHPPIMIGGGGEKRTLHTLARYGDVMNVFGTPAIVARKIRVLEEHCRAVGRDPSEIRKTVSGILIATDREDLVDRVAPLIGRGMGLSPEESKRQLPIGTPAHVRSVMEEYAKVGVTGFIMQQQAPFREDVFRRISDEVVAAFA
jgi:F420-dependent oxidoreductase-like protein